MFTKLVKNEFKATRRFIPLVYLVTVVTLLGNMAARRLEIVWLTGLSMFFLVLLGIGVVLVTYVLVITRYYKNLYGQEGYLMHTLPVSSGKLLASKVVVSFLWLVLSYAVAAAVFLYMAFLGTSESGLTLGSLRVTVANEMGIPLPLLHGLIIGVILYAILAILYSLSEFFFSISLGSVSRLHRLGIAGPIVVYLVTNFLIQLFILVGLVFVPLGITMEQGSARIVLYGMFRMISEPDRFVFGVGSLLFMILAGIGLLWGTRRLIARHTSLR